MGTWKRYAAAFLVNVGLTLLVLFARGFNLKIYYVDAFSVAGAVSILLGLFIWVVRAGMFDTVGYGFSTLHDHDKYRNLHEYSNRKKEKRSRRGRFTLPLLVMGLGFLGISFLIAVV
ncbi:MAG: DUF3899 domain-containing protein [Acetatifactor sp.]|nr:DUF3899 domain-containing protein [Acetatifactor sp.]